ncbi:MAG: metal-dependent phosphohydrolase [Treponema sp.]|nr:metal-dependent phosphohydrolase [Treponema sp.]
MAEKKSVVLLYKVVADKQNYIDACLSEDVVVICINRGTKKSKPMPFKVLYENNDQFWLQNKTWEYFISTEDFERVNEKAAIPEENWTAPEEEEVETEEEIRLEVIESPKAPEETKASIEEGFGKEYNSIAVMPIRERLVQLNENKKRLDHLIITKPKEERIITEALVDTAKDTMLHNHATLLSTINLSSEEAKRQTQGLVDSTLDFVKTSSQLISVNIFNDDLMKALVSKSDGTIIQHMIRVYLQGLAFLSYYNKMVSSSHMIHRLRVGFNNRYRRFYHILLPHIFLEDVTLERAFLGGMRTVTDEDFYNWTTGFLIHDIGKAAAVEYHEGESAYNRDIVMEHITVGYTSIINKTNYPEEAGLVTGYHHEYYGDEGGYGYYRNAFEQHKKLNPYARPIYGISYDVRPMMTYEALGYFPAKVLEICDVYDSLTDPNRKYRKAMSTDEALEMMLEEFIVKHQKIDFILYDIFARFIKDGKPR